MTLHVPASFGGDRSTLWILELLIALGGFGFSAIGQTHEEQAVAAILMGEAWSEGEQGMTAVAEVICQRAREKGWTPLRVVTFHRGRIHAFSCLNGTTIDQLIAKFRGQKDFQQALQIARIACQTPDRLPGLSRMANHYSRVEEQPYWARGQQPVAIIGRHAFYKLKNF